MLEQGVGMMAHIQTLIKPSKDRKLRRDTISHALKEYNTGKLSGSDGINPYIPIFNLASEAV